MLEEKIPLLREILVDAELHPENFDLTDWAWMSLVTCDTTVCIGGSAVLKTGHHIDWANRSNDGKCHYTTDGRWIAHVAQEELGLSDVEAARLFFCGSLDEAWQVAERISDGQITREALYATANG